MSDPLANITICIKGAGEMASAVAWRLHRANLRRIYMLEVPQPLAVRRRVSFCEAIYDGRQTIEDITAVKTKDQYGLPAAWKNGHIAVLVDPEGKSIPDLVPDVVIDAILAKRNLGTHKDQAALVIGLGPGFEASRDVHAVIETNRGTIWAASSPTVGRSPTPAFPAGLPALPSDAYYGPPDPGGFKPLAKSDNL